MPTGYGGSDKAGAEFPTITEVFDHIHTRGIGTTFAGDEKGWKETFSVGHRHGQNADSFNKF